jgi:hypothetical protein
MRADLDNLKNNLKISFEEFKALPFPDDSDDPNLSEIHAELAEYDGFVAGLIDSILAGAKVLPNELQIDKKLRSRLTELLNSSNTEVKNEAESYLEYLNKLEQLVQSARLVARYCL